MNREIDPASVDLAAGEYRIRAVDAGDRDGIIRAGQSPRFGGVMPWFPQPFPEHFADAWLEHALASWERGEHWTLTILDPGGDYCGAVAFSAMDDGESVEIGYWLQPEHERGGLATRAVVSATAWAFAAFAPVRAFARVRAENVASCRVLEKAGYTELEPGGGDRRFERRWHS